MRIDQTKEARRLKLKQMGDDHTTKTIDEASWCELNGLLRARIRDLEDATCECRGQLTAIMIETNGHLHSRIFRAARILDDVMGEEKSSEQIDIEEAIEAAE